MQDAGDVEGAGVLLRQFDKNNDMTNRWMPCPKEGADSWCKDLADRWAASILNANTPHLYEPTTGGLILAPDSVRLLCAYPEDGDSMHGARASAFKPRVLGTPAVCCVSVCACGSPGAACLATFRRVRVRASSLCVCVWLCSQELCAVASFAVPGASIRYIRTRTAP